MFINVKMLINSIYGEDEVKNYDDENTVGEMEKYPVHSNNINCLNI